MIYQNGKAKALTLSAQGSSAKEVYSTEEQVIGTWIDGKPLYRKTFSVHFTTSAINNVTYVPISVDDTMNVVKINGFLDILNKAWTGRYIIPYVQYVSSGLLTLSYYVDYLAHKTYIAYRVDDVYAYSGETTLEYTKTTDQPTIQVETQPLQSIADMKATYAIPVTFGGFYTEEVDADSAKQEEKDYE